MNSMSLCGLATFCVLLVPVVTAAVDSTPGECWSVSGAGCAAATGEVEEEVSMMQEHLQFFSERTSLHDQKQQQQRRYQQHQQQQRQQQQHQRGQQASTHEAPSRQVASHKGVVREATASEQGASHSFTSKETVVAGATTTTTTEVDATGVTLNAAGDLVIFVTGVAEYGIMAICMVIFFSVMRRRYEIVYAHNSMTGVVSIKPDETFWGWVRASTETKLEEAIEAIGLDNALMIEFCNVMIKMFGTIAVPMFCIIGPMNWAFGGLAAGDDHLSYLSFGNVEFGSWMYWVHAFVTWGVVLVVQSHLYAAQRRFLEYRYTWLRKMAEKRANTIMVDHIPEHLRSDAKLGEFFEKIIPGDDNVKSAYVTKDTTHLLHLCTELETAEAALQKANAQWDKSQAEGKSDRPTFGGSCGGRVVDCIDHYTELINDLRPKIAEEREKVRKEAEEVGGVNLNSGFVTFKDRMSAEVALRLTGITEDKSELILESPPEPQDIQWNDFTQDQNARQGRELLGYGLTLGLWAAYLPIVVAITNIANVIDLGPLNMVWASVAPTMGLQVMVAMLPTFLITIYKFCFTLKAAAWAQYKLQAWYFWFQVFFVLLIAAIGTNILAFVDALFTDPFSMFGVLADTLPYATHYYMNYLVLQWFTHGMVLTRYIPLTKFKFFCQLFEEEDAKKMAEPEDQDYYGIGSRSAQWVTLALIGLVYGTMSPPVSVLTVITFAIMRLFYGYLVVFAETKKPDLGGVFWATLLRHMFIGLLLYTIVMTGVFYRRGNNAGPMLIALPSVFYVLWSKQRFESAFSWETLPFEELTDQSTLSAKKRELEGEYMQPEMIKS